MTRYFDDDDHYKALTDELDEWMGTPFQHHAMVKGRGADCTTFIGGVLLNLGLLTEVKYDYYPKDWHIHGVDGQQFLLQESIEGHIKEKLVEPLTLEIADEIKRGDMITLWTEREGIPNHALIALEDGMMIHCGRHGVQIRPLIHSWMERRMINTHKIVEKS